LLVKLPGNRDAGRLVTESVEGVDVPTTVLRVLGLDGAMPVDGRVILPGTLDGVARPRFTQSEDAELVGVQYGMTKLVVRIKPSALSGRSHPERAVFDLAADPAEKHPMAGALTASMASLEAEVRRDYEPIAGAAEQPMAADQEERLRSLGYVR
jgi:arylsulfatase A-like enzyme